MRRPTALLLALPAVLAAQDKALETQGKPQESLAQRWKAESPALEKLKKERNGEEILARLGAIIPAVKPAFDTTSPSTGLASSAEYSALMVIYSEAGKAALMDGQWEKGLEFFQKAEAVAKENAASTAAVMTPVMENWTKAVVDGKKALEEGAARRAELKAKANRDEREAAELKNFEVYENNVRTGPITVAKIKGSLDGLKSDSEGFAKVIEDVTRSLDTEKADLGKFKNDKIKYVAAVFNPTNLASQKSLADKLNFLARLKVLDPKNAKVRREFDKAMGRPVAPEPKAPSKGKKKKGK